MVTLALVFILFALSQSSCNYYLSSSDFALGTYRITKSGTYCLTEDISFNPVPGTNASPNIKGAWFPGFYDSAYGFGTTDFSNPALGDTFIGPKFGPFALGFFAVITVETSDVIIDLKGFTIGQSFAHYIQQRYFAIIEIGNTPFATKQGPNGMFGTFVSELKNIVIKNGEIGLSSHHGIHSNNAKNVLLTDLKIKDFEVGGIQLNGFDGATIDNVEIGPSSTQVPVNSLYSGARFTLQGYYGLRRVSGLKSVDDYSITFSGGRTLTIKEIIERLRTSLDIVFRNAMNAETAEDLANPLRASALELFASSNGNLPDGSSIYGALFNSFGVAVLGFGDSNNGVGQGLDLTIKDLTIKDLTLDTMEIPGIYFSKCDNDPSNDATAIRPTIANGGFGEILDLSHTFQASKRRVLYDGGDMSDLKYVGNVLSDAQIALYKYAVDNDADAYGGNMPDELLKWALDGNYENLPTCVDAVCNVDIMFHSNKGAVALRLDGIENVIVKDMTIKNIVNKGIIAAKVCGNYTSSFDGGSIFQLDGEGNMQTDVRGISVFDCDVKLLGKVTIDSLTSCYGDVIGVDLLDENNIQKKSEPMITNLAAGTKVTTALYNQLQAEGLTPNPNKFDKITVRISDATVIQDIVYAKQEAHELHVVAEASNQGNHVWANVAPPIIIFIAGILFACINCFCYSKTSQYKKISSQINGSVKIESTK